MLRNMTIVIAALSALNSVAVSLPKIDSFIAEKEAALLGKGPAMYSNPDNPAPKCGTSVTIALKVLRDNGIELPDNALEDRPVNLQLTFGSANFLIHYTDTGTDIPYHPTVDTLPADGVPDYINDIASIFEYVISVETGDTSAGGMGFNHPLSDNGAGGDNRYDIYVLNLGTGYYGYAVPEGSAGQYQLPSFIELDNDFAGTIYQNNPSIGVKITAAHEFFHAIQFGYDAVEFDYDDPGDPNTYKPWWLEASAVWAEDVVYDSLNDYLNYLRFFYRYPWMGLGTFSYDVQGNPNRAYHPYASCVWPIFLSEHYGVSIIKEIWEGCASVIGYNTLSSTNNALHLRSSSLSSAFLEFSVWNYHTGSRANPTMYYSEGLAFPEVVPTDSLGTPTSTPVIFGDYSNFPEHLGSNYLVIQPGTSPGGIAATFDGQDIAFPGWHNAILGYDPMAGQWIEFAVDPYFGTGSIQWYNWDNFTDLVIIPTVSGTTPYYNSYSYTGSVAYDSSLHDSNVVYVWPGDLDNNGVVNEEDIIPLAAYWYESGSARDSINYTWSAAPNSSWITPEATFADADGSGQVDIRDFLAICLNWNLTHIGTYNYSLQPPEFDIDSHRSILETIYDEVRDSESGPQLEIRLYLERLLGISVPRDFVLWRNYPNPFNNRTVIRFQLVGRSHVRLVIFDLLGRQVSILVDENKPAGVYSATWNGRDDNGDYAASGIYFYRLESSSGRATRKMLLIK